MFAAVAMQPRLLRVAGCIGPRPHEGGKSSNDPTSWALESPLPVHAPRGWGKTRSLARGRSPTHILSQHSLGRSLPAARSLRESRSLTSQATTRPPVAAASSPAAPVGRAAAAPPALAEAGRPVRRGGGPSRVLRRAAGVAIRAARRGSGSNDPAWRTFEWWRRSGVRRGPAPVGRRSSSGERVRARPLAGQQRRRRALVRSLLRRRRPGPRERRRRRAGLAHHHGLERAVEVLDRRRHHGRFLAEPPDTVRLGDAVAFAQIGIVGLDGQIELEAMRLYGLPEGAPALLTGTPTLPSGSGNSPRRSPSIFPTWPAVRRTWSRRRRARRRGRGPSGGAPPLRRNPRNPAVRRAGQSRSAAAPTRAGAGRCR